MSGWAPLTDWQVGVVRLAGQGLATARWPSPPRRGDLADRPSWTQIRNSASARCVARTEGATAWSQRTKATAGISQLLVKAVVTSRPRASSRVASFRSRSRPTAAISGRPKLENWVLG
jgi:hypothetical protein